LTGSSGTNTTANYLYFGGYAASEESNLRTTFNSVTPNDANFYGAAMII